MRLGDRGPARFNRWCHRRGFLVALWSLPVEPIYETEAVRPVAKPVGSPRARQPAGRLKVRLYVTWAAVLFRACKPVVEINGERHDSEWGVVSFDVAPGRVRVRIWFPYLAMPMCGLNEVEVEIPAGSTRRLQYMMPPLMFLKAQLVEVDHFTV